MSTEAENDTWSHAWRHAFVHSASVLPQDMLSRTNYDEQKCRNVLVRYCAHIPRNYQYRDGVQLVFLVLREHLGDENLDLAGGVLYELIEIDCEHSDDPGAEFQRWKHDHLNRHEHSSRYSTRLSDYRPSARVNSAEPSCIRSHKAWMIEHTMYVTSQEGGTCVFRSPNPKEFHEMLWDIGSGKTEKLVKEERAQPKRVVSPEYGQGKRNDTIETKKSRLTVLEAGERWTLLHASKHGRTTGEHRRTGDENSIKHRSWFPGIFGLNNLAPVQTPVDLKSVPLPEGCAMPHAIFARKFALVADGVPLPTSLSHELMPTADIKARNLLVEAAAQGLMNPTYEFRGPFTPQLGFDGGLDHQYISTGAVTSALASYKAAYHIPQPNHGESPPLIKPQRYQRGHDWFGLDAPTSQSRSANRSLRGSEKPKDAHGTSQWKTNGRHAYPADNWYGLDGAGNKENGLRRTVAIMNVG